MDVRCRVRGCDLAAVARELSEPEGRHRWGGYLTLTVEDVAATWPLCSDHATALIEAALETVGRTLTGWGVDEVHLGPGDR